ncbi:MAG: SPOR domain-containing protein [Candidatus Omnitrophica bacterium]|nr:SPOR domain-containing protein [Candidatus Omnitrophota bacterium]MCM8799547.1 SPOR domain-containing protein [Candidatus Omnitrophota bacterium]
MKGKPLQLEIFKDQTIKENNSLSNWWVIHNYEKKIIFIIVLLLVGVISFSLGVKKGENIALIDNKQKNEILNKEHIFEEEAKENIQQALIQREDKLSANYTIQVATYKTSSFAYKESEKLKKKGFLTMILQKGDYILLCVGKFLNKKEAELALRELKKEYRDCFIRRL